MEVETVPRHVLYQEGVYETGCFTEAGNELALVCQTTRVLHDMRERRFRCALEVLDFIPRRGVARYDVTRHCGPHVPTLVHDYFYEKVRDIYRATVRERGRDDIKLLPNTYADFVLWTIREFERWLNDNIAEKTMPKPQPAPQPRITASRGGALHPWVDFEKHFEGKWHDDPTFPFKIRVLVFGRVGPRHFPEYILPFGQQLTDDIANGKPFKVPDDGKLFIVFPEHRLAMFEQQNFMQDIMKNPSCKDVKFIEMVTNSPLIVGNFVRHQIRIVTPEGFG